MTPTEAINTLYCYDMDILHIDDWRLFTPQKRYTPKKTETIPHILRPYDYRNMDPALFYISWTAPKSSKTIAWSQSKCAGCEICSYHLGLESPDLSPPFKDM
jgi:hypothetical protein